VSVRGLRWELRRRATSVPSAPAPEPDPPTPHMLSPHWSWAMTSLGCTVWLVLCGPWALPSKSSRPRASILPPGTLSIFRKKKYCISSKYSRFVQSFSTFRFSYCLAAYIVTVYDQLIIRSKIGENHIR
jgi:hypothetical protein